jgi:hypothetical protein
MGDLASKSKWKSVKGIKGKEMESSTDANDKRRQNFPFLFSYGPFLT